MQSFVKPIAGAPMIELGYQTLRHGRVQFDALDGWRMLVIYRGRHCPLCQAYLQTLDELLPEFDALGVAVHAVSSDPESRAREQAEQQRWRFAVGYELGIEDMRKLGLYISTPLSPDETDRPFAEPAVIVVNPGGRMQIIDISNAPYARPDLRQLLDGIRTIQQEHYPPRSTG